MSQRLTIEVNFPNDLSSRGERAVHEAVAELRQAMEDYSGTVQKADLVTLPRPLPKTVDDPHERLS